MPMIETREEIALLVSQAGTLGEVLSALSQAIRECQEEGRLPELDPAVGLILERAQGLVVASGYDRTEALTLCRESQARRMAKPKLIQFAEKSLGYDMDRKKAFHTEAVKQLHSLARALGYQKGDYEVGTNFGGIAVSGETILHTDHLYLQVFQGMGKLGDILYRSCEGRKDYTGGRNNFAFLKDLNDIRAFARRLHHELDDGRMPPLPDETIGMLL